MFNRRTFSDMRRAGMGIGVSKNKLTHAMLEILIQLPEGTTRLKETIVENLGMAGQIASVKEINEAWNDAKKKAAKEYPDKFIVDNRKILHWNDGSVKVMDQKISHANFKKLSELADAENCTTNQMLTKMIRFYQKGKA